MADDKDGHELKSHTGFTKTVYSEKNQISYLQEIEP